MRRLKRAAAHVTDVLAHIAALEAAHAEGRIDVGAAERLQLLAQAVTAAPPALRSLSSKWSQLPADTVELVARGCILRLRLVCRTWLAAIDGGRQQRERPFSGTLALTASTLNKVMFLDGALRQASDSFDAVKLPEAITAMPPKLPSAAKKTSKGTRYRWPVGVAASNGQLYVTQYRVCGLLEYTLNGDNALLYRRMLSAPMQLDGAEGVVVGDTYVYVVSVSYGTVLCIDRKTLRIVSKVGQQQSGLADLIMWGMTQAADGHLYVCAHTRTLEEAEAYDSGNAGPTAENTGVILRVKIDANGDFDGGLHIFCGESILNVPHAISFCIHGTMLVTSCAGLHAFNSRGEHLFDVGVDTTSVGVEPGYLSAMVCSPCSPEIFAGFALFASSDYGRVLKIDACPCRGEGRLRSCRVVDATDNIGSYPNVLCTY